ncbi:MAG: DUF169 domain-containing protein [Clostridiales bacterium]|nr:DUF169 domain-containing protein [Clostridiales bacterium]
MITPLKTDLSIWNELKLEAPPVGVKYLYEKSPEGVSQIEGEYALCELIKVAQESEDPFFMTLDNEMCVGRFIMGMLPWPPGAKGGQLGPELKIFKEGRANSRLYDGLPQLKEDTVNSVVFAPLQKIEFDPDLLLVLAEPQKAEIILRAMAYSTGERYVSNAQTVIVCAYVFAYPMLTGKVNYIMTGLSFGMKAYKLFKPGQILLSIPYQWIPTITQNLGEMDWVLPAYEMTPDEYRQYFPTLLKK